ncbi:MAG TPA: cytochrome d ubiquinol oxidase subunit II [Myxococcaceae bacterium]|nr:cytochrome d ubiquinol oxidase subunit II [Myxococcaceae bacterium]
MEALWFAIVAGMLAVYVVLDGFDFGAGFLHLLVARTDAERRSVLAAIGPVWDGNEVWLIAGGGALFMAFPVAYAVGFSGFYLPLMLLLWVLILRGLSIELRSHVSDPLWAAFWDATFALGSTLIAIVLGAALGNVLRGVPLDSSGTFHVSLFDSFWPSARSGVLDAYTVLVGVFTLLALGGHGGLYLAIKTDERVHTRSLRAARLLWVCAGALFPLVTWATTRVAPELPATAAHRPLVWILVVLLVASASALVLGLVRGNPALGFAGSAGTLFTLLGTGAAARWPVLLRSNLAPSLSLDAFAAATTHHGLRVALSWTLVGLPLACGYFVFLARAFRGKVRLETPAHAAEHGSPRDTGP